MAAMSLQLQEVMFGVETRSEVVRKDLEEINRWFDHHRGEINHLKKREEELKGLIINAGHKANVFETWLDQTECHGMTFSDPCFEHSTHSFHCSWTSSFSFLLLSLSQA